MANKETSVKPGLGFLFDHGSKEHRLDADSWLRMYTDTQAIWPSLVGETRVTTIYYCKCRDRWEHEFLRVSVEADNPSVVSHMIIERLYDPRQDKINPKSNNVDESEMNYTVGESSTLPPSPPPSGPPSPSPPPSSSKAVFDVLKGDRRALDDITIYRSLSKLEQDKPCDILASRHFSGDKPFTLEQLLVLTNTVTKNTPQYNLIAAQCYWFAHSLWTVISLLSQGQFREKQYRMDRQGTVGGMDKKYGVGSNVRDTRQPPALREQFQTAWSEFETKMEEVRRQDRRLEEERRQADIRVKEAVKDALKEAEAKIQRLERLVEQRGDGQ